MPYDIPRLGTYLPITSRIQNYPLYSWQYSLYNLKIKCVFKNNIQWMLKYRDISLTSNIKDYKHPKLFLEDKLICTDQNVNKCNLSACNKLIYYSQSVKKKNCPNTVEHRQTAFSSPSLIIID